MRPFASTTLSLTQSFGIDEATLSRFAHGKGGLSMEGIDLLGEALGLSISIGDPPCKGGKRE